MSNDIGTVSSLESNAKYSASTDLSQCEKDVKLWI